MSPQSSHRSILLNIGLALAFLLTLALSAASAYTAWYTADVLQPYLDARYNNDQSAQEKCVFIFWITAAALFASAGIKLLGLIINNSCGLSCPRDEEEYLGLFDLMIQFLVAALHVGYAIVVLCITLDWKDRLVQGQRLEAWVGVYDLMIVLLVIDLVTVSTATICIVALVAVAIYAACASRPGGDSEPSELPDLEVSTMTQERGSRTSFDSV